MFQSIPHSVLEVMRQLEEDDAQDRIDGTPGAKRLRQIPPETGQFIALIAACSPEGAWVELGTSAGYSSLWLSLAAQERAQSLETVEADPRKVERARVTFSRASVSALVKIRPGDARQYLAEMERGIAFCFMDVDKVDYQACYDLLLPKLVAGGLLVIDNLISHADSLADFREFVLADERVDGLVLPLGKGLLLARRTAT
jgi:predicted O-methyltransferase YrrM